MFTVRLIACAPVPAGIWMAQQSFSDSICSGRIEWVPVTVIISVHMAQRWGYRHLVCILISRVGWLRFWGYRREAFRRLPSQSAAAQQIFNIYGKNLLFDIRACYTCDSDVK